MDISKAVCPECNEPLKVGRMACPKCHLAVEGDFEVSALGKLSPEDQVFVIAFLRHHGSIKKMESLFGISYPTVKNRLNAISARLDKSFEAPSSNLTILEQLSRGELSVADALERLTEKRQGEK
ncbi:MAG TPA: DUF2089 domain-containing protein [Candidatus Nitrosotalea sp.]|nr:DUF2089 domain-containing protein [Candidatus Nitrosotalea sp.]